MRLRATPALLCFLVGCPVPALQTNGGEGPGGQGGAGGETAEGGGGGGEGGGCAQLDDACNVGTASEGGCIRVPRADGTPCDDGLACTSEEYCEAGTCSGGVPAACLAPDACHVVSCNEVSGLCEVTIGNDGAPCSDLDVCTTEDQCAGGVCVGGPPLDCGGIDSECGFGVCVIGQGCVAQPVGSAVPCTDDGNPCTADYCNDVEPICGFPADGGDCDDADPCTDWSVCSGGVCTVQSPSDDGAPCDLGYCFPSAACQSGVCEAAPRDCPVPAEACLVASCTLNGGDSGACIADWLPAEQAPCDSACSSSGSCQRGHCTGGSPANDGGGCDDRNACTAADTCASGSCGGVPITVCNAGDGCCPAGCSAPTDTDCSARLYLTSGNGGAGFYAFDLATQGWSTLPDPPVPTYHRLASDGVSVFLLGSDHRVYRFDPLTNGWSYHEDGPGPDYVAPGPTQLFVWTPHGLHAQLNEIPPLLRESGPAWGATDLGGLGAIGPARWDAEAQTLVVRNGLGFSVVDGATGAVSSYFGLGAASGRGGTFHGGWFYLPVDDGMGGAELMAQEAASLAIVDTGITLDDPEPETEVDPATGDLYFAPSQPTGTFQVLRTPSLSLDPLTPPPALPMDWAPVIVIARAPSQ